jgi:hypothetical protein
MLLISCIFLAIIAALLWLYMAAIILSSARSDAAGEAIGRALCAFAAIGVWIIVAVLALIAGVTAHLQIGSGLAALILIPASGYAATVAIEVSGRDSRFNWANIVPLVVPPLVIVYCFWSIFGSAGSSTLISLLLWSIILILIPLPLIARQRRQIAVSETYQKFAAQKAIEETRRQEEIRRQKAETFRTLTPDSPFRQWWEYTEAGNEFRAQALDGARKVNNREPQIAEMLQTGFDRTLFFALPNLDLRLTPDLQQAAPKFLLAEIKSLIPYDPAKPIATKVVTDWFDQYLPTIGWLVANQANCDAELSVLAEAVNKYPDCAERKSFLEKLEQLKTSGREKDHL